MDGRGTGGARARASAIPLAIVALAAGLRLWAIGADHPNPFYDAAVRSMGLSWHNFFFGALEPGGSLAIDKPPVDLWLQVASTKLLGFDRTALALPEALGGAAAVALLYGAVTRMRGRLAGALAALALAVLPIAVLTSRSDTMDSVMSALLIAALWCALIAVQSRRARYVLASAALVGLAFEVKLAQALVPLPALALLWWASGERGRRIKLLGAAAAVLVATAMSWALIASLTPASRRPLPMGSHNGSIYKAMFVFNGVERLSRSNPRLTGLRSPPGATRLLSGARPAYATLIGMELVAAAALLGAAAALAISRRGAWRGRGSGRRAPPPRDRRTRWAMAALAMWLAIAYVLFSFVGRLEPRYLEAASPAVAASLGIAAAYLLGKADTRLGGWLCAGALAVNAGFAMSADGPTDVGVLVGLAATAIALIGLSVAHARRALSASPKTRPSLRTALIALVTLSLLAAPAEASIDLVGDRSSDANPAGSGGQFSAYLRAHRHGAHFEAAAGNPLAAVGLIVDDAQPVLMLRSVDGTLVSVKRLERLVGKGAVRFLILPRRCLSGPECTPAIAWSVRHSVEVRKGLYRYRISPHGR